MVIHDKCSLAWKGGGKRAGGQDAGSSRGMGTPHSTAVCLLLAAFWDEDKLDCTRSPVPGLDLDSIWVYTRRSQLSFHVVGAGRRRQTLFRRVAVAAHEQHRVRALAEGLAGRVEHLLANAGHGDHRDRKSTRLNSSHR